MSLPVLEQDSANHVFYGALIASVGSIGFGIMAAAIAVIIIAAIKELYDRITGTGAPEMKDMLYTVFGGVLVVLPQYIGLGLIYGTK